mgnify:CR=1 FL=1
MGFASRQGHSRKCRLVPVHPVARVLVLVAPLFSIIVRNEEVVHLTVLEWDAAPFAVREGKALSFLIDDCRTTSAWVKLKEETRLTELGHAGVRLDPLLSALRRLAVQVVVERVVVEVILSCALLALLPVCHVLHPRLVIRVVLCSIGPANKTFQHCLSINQAPENTHM